MPNKSDTIKERLLKALEQSLGVVTTACKNAMVHRSTYYDYCKNDPEFKKQVDDIQNVALDFAESQLHKQIGSGNTSATIFYLKTKGSKRGYIEKQDITQTTNLKTNLSFSDIIKSIKSDGDK